jgi:ADP-ribosylation factor-binding protein GGA
VVDRVLYLIQLWSRNIVDEPKIREVYNMLKKQGIKFPDLTESPDVAASNVPRGQGVCAWPLPWLREHERGAGLFMVA